MAKIHIHTKYSLLDAIIEPEELVKKVKEQDGNKGREGCGMACKG